MTAEDSQENISMEYTMQTTSYPCPQAKRRTMASPALRLRAGYSVTKEGFND